MLQNPQEKGSLVPKSRAGEALEWLGSEHVARAPGAGHPREGDSEVAGAVSVQHPGFIACPGGRAEPGWQGHSSSEDSFLPTKSPQLYATGPIAKHRLGPQELCPLSASPLYAPRRQVSEWEHQQPRGEQAVAWQAWVPVPALSGAPGSPEQPFPRGWTVRSPFRGQELPGNTTSSLISGFLN